MKNLKLTHITSAAELSGFVRTTRLDLALTQKEVGDQIGVKQARIAQIENFTGLVSCEQLLQVLKALRIQLYLSEPAPADAEQTPPTAPPGTGQDRSDSLW